MIQPLANRRRNLIIILILGALSTVSPFSIDMYLASFPHIASDMHTAALRVSLSVSSYFIGLAAGQALYGPLLDRFGRRRPLYAGMAVYVLASLACAMTRGIDALIVLRFVQALGGCVAAVAATAMVRDFFPVKESAKIFSLLMLILGVSPLLAPIAGSAVSAVFGWPCVFILLAAIAALITAATARWLPEGHVPDPTISLRPGPILATFRDVLAEPQFYTYTFAGALGFAGLFVYVAGSSLIFMGQFHVSAAIYSCIFAGLAAGFIGSNQVNIMLGRYFGSAAVLRGALTAQLVVALAFLAAVLSGHCGLLATIGFFFCYLSCTGLTYPNGAALAMAPFAKNAGSAAALLGFFQMGIGALVSSGVGLSGASGTLPVVILFVVSSGLALAVLLVCRRRIVRPIETDAQEAAFAAH